MFSFNPNYFSEYNNGSSDREDVLANIQADYQVNKFIDLNAKYGLDYSQAEANVIFKNQSGNINSNAYFFATGYYGTDNTGEFDRFTQKTTFQNLIASAIIKTDFKRDFHLNIPITTSTLLAFDNRKNYFTNFVLYGYSLPLYSLYNFQQTLTQSVLVDVATPFVTYGYVVNQKIDYGEYGGMAGGFRSDYSSAFGEGSKPFTFPDINAYIRPSSFNFWNKAKLTGIIPEFKIRAAYGEAGIQPMPFDRYPNITRANLGSSLVYSLPTAEK